MEKSIYSQFTSRCFIAEGVGQGKCSARNGSWLKGSREKMAGNGFKWKKKMGSLGFCSAGIKLQLNKDELEQERIRNGRGNHFQSENFQLKHAGIVTNL